MYQPKSDQKPTSRVNSIQITDRAAFFVCGCRASVSIPSRAAMVARSEIGFFWLHFPPFPSSDALARGRTSEIV